MCIIKSPTLPVFVGIISSFMFGMFFVMYGLDDKELGKKSTSVYGAKILEYFGTNICDSVEKFLKKS